jgi:hypothetical protein
MNVPDTERQFDFARPRSYHRATVRQEASVTQQMIAAGNFRMASGTLL